MTQINNTLSLTVSTTEIVAAYLSHHQMPTTEVPALICQVHQSLTSLSSTEPSHLPLRSEPAVPIEKSITPDYIICLEDGQQLKMLKRHLHTNYKMTPQQYRNRWGLPSNYPMVAPNYARKRSSIAKSVGLGRPRKTNAV